MDLCPYVCLSVSLSVCMYVCLSVRVYVWLGSYRVPARAFSGSRAHAEVLQPQFGGDAGLLPERGEVRGEAGQGEPLQRLRGRRFPLGRHPLPHYPGLAASSLREDV